MAFDLHALQSTSRSTRRLTPLASAVVLALAGCGGTVTDAPADTAAASGVSVAASFPTGLSVGLPTEVSAASASTSSASGPIVGPRYLADF